MCVEMELMVVEINREIINMETKATSFINKHNTNNRFKGSNQEEQRYVDKISYKSTKQCSYLCGAKTV